LALLGALGSVAAMAQTNVYSLTVGSFLMPAGSTNSVITCPIFTNLSLSNFDEVCQVLRTNLAGFKAEQLDRDAVQGLIRQLEPRVSLVAGNESTSSGPALAGVRVLDGAFAWFHVGAVTANLPGEFRAAWKELARTNKGSIKGLVLDLRFANGFDYGAAAGLADCFLNSDQPLLDWQAGSAHATFKTDAITIPVAVLVNSQTTGAAEALAAALRETDVGLVLGGVTAGRADTFKEFPLRDGSKLRVAVAQVHYGAGKILTAGVTPDIPIHASLEDERAYLKDPWKALQPGGTAGAEVAKQGTESPRRNEVELIREHSNGGKDTKPLVRDVPQAAELSPQVTDPVLARALDLLKGLAVVRPNRPG
jgi:carboxyl-terminal processing protease